MSEKPTIRKRTNKTPKKLCVKCGKVLPLNDFYRNREWSAQSYRDAWCKKCVNDFCTTRESLREYCWYNNRAWSDEYYDQALNRAMYSLSTSGDYLSAGGKDAEQKRKRLEEEAACRSFLGIMNLAGLYHYTENVDTDGNYRTYNEKSGEGTIASNPQEPGLDDGELIFSREWNGLYTQRELDYLNDYYAQLEEGFVLDNQNIQDYARKAAKASLDADIKYNRMRQGLVSVAEWEKAQAIFDNLSKSANFAACKRKPGDMAGLGSLGAIVAKIEMNGELDTPQAAFPPDDIDRIIADFRHTVAAVGLEQVTV